MLDKSIQHAGIPALFFSVFIFFVAAFILPQSAFSQEDPVDTAAYDRAQCPEDHEKYGDELGIYSFDSHYLYRSNDFSRLGATSDELACYSCHPEHNGKEASITMVSDAQCQTCHEVESFNNDHPEFHG